MIKCPICKLEISHIICETSEYYRYIIRLPENEREKGEIEYDPDTGLVWIHVEDSNIVEDRFICPLCRKEIAQDDEEVKGLLKGGE